MENREESAFNDYCAEVKWRCVNMLLFIKLYSITALKAFRYSHLWCVLLLLLPLHECRQRHTSNNNLLYIWWLEYILCTIRLPDITTSSRIVVISEFMSMYRLKQHFMKMCVYKSVHAMRAKKCYCRCFKRLLHSLFFPLHWPTDPHIYNSACMCAWDW